jgi:hypothetical protein
MFFNSIWIFLILNKILEGMQKIWIFHQNIILQY